MRVIYLEWNLNYFIIIIKILVTIRPNNRSCIITLNSNFI
nr:MAG TPA: hypothetical protein [Caudoviricetes sp.]